MKLISTVLALAAAAGITSAASAAITFSDISVTGAIAGTPSTPTGPFDIDVAFNVGSATVGDPTSLYGTHMITITYTGTSDSGPINAATLSLLGAAAGTGAVEVQTTIVENGTSDTIATNTLAFNAGTPPPVFSSFGFSRGVTSFRVTQMVHLSATATETFDLAQLSLVESRYTPAPGAMALLGLGGLVAGRRRR